MKLAVRSPRVQGYLFAVGAALAYGGSQVMAKQIVGEVSPLVGSAFGLLFGTLILGVATAPSVARQARAPARAYLWAALAGVAASSGVVFMFFAMSQAPVVVVSPILAINPLLAILLGQLFIRRLERLTLRVAVGALLVVAGVTLIAVTRE